MANDGRKNYWRIFLASRWFLLLLLAISVLISFAYGRAYYQDYQVRQEIERLKKDMQKIETKKLETIELLKYVKSTAFIEEKARTELNMVKPGEQVVVLEGGVDTNNPQSDKKNLDQTEGVSNFVKWWRFFWQGLPNKE